MNKIKYNQLRKEIIKANEDIMALKMGCVIMFAAKGILFRAAIYQQNYAGNYLIETIGEATTTIKRSQIKEIIGRDILLEDCLIAIGETDYIFSTSDDGFLWAMDARTLESGKCFWAK